MKTFGYVSIDEFGNSFYTDDAFRFGKQIFETINLMKEEFKAKHELGYKFNVEAVPRKSGHIMA